MTERPILIVDDDPDTVEIVRTFLEDKGYRVTAAMDGKEALAEMEESKPSLILLDVMMPRMDGWEVARVVKDHPDMGDVRVVMLTARGEFEDKQEGLRSGADDYIVKPIDLEDLAERVERNLQARERPE